MRHCFQLNSLQRLFRKLDSLHLQSNLHGPVLLVRVQNWLWQRFQIVQPLDFGVVSLKRPIIFGRLIITALTAPSK